MRGSQWLIATALLFASVARALPPPDADQFGDEARMLEWDRPFPIPGLSQSAQAIIRASRTHRLGAPALQKAYAERRARVVGLAHSAEIASLLGLRAGRDRLVPLPGPNDARVAAFQQELIVSRTEPPVRVNLARVSFYIGADGVSVSGIMSGFQPDLSPPLARVSAADAVASATAALLALRAPPLQLVNGAPERFVVRAPFPAAGVRPSGVVRRENDRMYYGLRFRDANFPDAGDVMVDVDAVTAAVERIYTLDAHGVGVAKFSDYQNQVWKIGPLLLPPEDVVLCWEYDGHGKDPDGIERFFSTTYDLSQQKYFTSSCYEAQSRLILKDDVQTFKIDNPLAPAYYLSDADDAWDVPLQPETPDAVATQFWGERVIRWFKQKGYATRRDQAQTPLQFRALVRKGAAALQNNAEWKAPGSNRNGMAVFYPHVPFNATASLATMADPAWIAHEFGHSVVYDVAGFGTGDKTKEVASISEGLADCFASMVLVQAYLEQELSPQYLGQFESGPWMQGHGSFRGTFPDTAGFPSLVNPKLTWWGKPLPYTYWSGQRASVLEEKGAPEAEARYEVNSTLVGGVCRLLVDGGPNPVLLEAIKETGGGSCSGGSCVDALAPGNVPLSTERTGQLLVETITTAQQYPQTFHGLIDALAMGAGQLAQSEWLLPKNQTSEKVRRAFAEYGFGRGVEGKAPHGHNEIISAQKSENLIATGLSYFREITGEICCADEDFFVVNEEAQNGDSVEYAITTAPPSASVDVRLYDDWPCAFEEGTTIKYCAKDHQFYPPVSAPNYDTAASFVPPSSALAQFPSKPGNRPVYVGLRLKGPATSSAVKYTLTVKIKRASSVYP